MEVKSLATAIIINLIAIGFLIYSFKKNKKNSKNALKIALIKGVSLAPWMIGIIVVIGIMLSFIPPEVIEQYLGGEMTFYQVAGAALVGTVSFIPNLVSLPLAGSLIESGASYTPIAAFFTTLTMVGFITLPLELKELGKKITIWRNIFAFIFALLISFAVGFLM